jgi:hypothetical protein
MKKYLGIFLFILLTACGSIPSIGQEPLATHALAATPQNITPSVTPSETPEPTATIGYQATAIVAQQTADAASRLMVEATAQHEALINEQIGYTAESERQEMQILEWTATAAPSSIPATQTQTYLNDKANATRQSMMITSVVMTQQAPTMIIAMAQAETQARFAPINAGIYVFAIFSISCFLIGMTVWFLRRPVEMGTQTESEETPEEPYELDLGTVVNVKKNNDGYLSTRRMVVPCTPEQLTELAEGLISGEKTLAINQWEGRNTKLTRDTFMAVRNFLQTNQYVRNAGGVGNLALTADGEAFFREWREKQTLPPSFEFFPGVDANAPETSHDHENHERNHGAGEVVYG